MILLDTCALLWWTLEPDALSERAAAACEKIDDSGGCVSSISIWEIGVKWKRKALDLGGIDLNEYTRRLEKVDGLEIIPVSAAIWVESVSLDWEHRDPADRVIVATARLRNIPIVTKDDIVGTFYNRTIW